MKISARDHLQGVSADVLRLGVAVGDLVQALDRRHPAPRLRYLQSIGQQHQESPQAMGREALEGDLHPAPGQDLKIYPRGVEQAQEPLVAACGQPQRPHDARYPEQVRPCADGGESRQEPKEVALAIAGDPQRGGHRAPRGPQAHGVRLNREPLAAS